MLAPPTNQSTFNQWTIGAVYYSALITAEVIGPTNTSQITDLLGNNASYYTPQYAVYENGALSRVALFNYINDPSGQSTYNATLQFNGGSAPSEVSVKFVATSVYRAILLKLLSRYFLSESVSTKDNITWAGQTFGTQFTVDGRLRGDLSIDTIQCDTTANTCVISVPAPGFALVFISSTALQESNPTSEMTFSTTAYTQTGNTVTVNPSVLATSNGHSGVDREQLGSTSKGSVSSGHSTLLLSAGSTVAMMVLATMLFIFREI